MSSDEESNDLVDELPNSGSKNNSQSSVRFERSHTIVQNNESVMKTKKYDKLSEIKKNSESAMKFAR